MNLQCIEQKFLTDAKPKRTRRYDGTHVNIASFVNRFQTWQKTEHGRNNNMKASWWAWCTHHKAMHDKTSIPTAIWQVYEAIHGKRKYIACMKQIQQVTMLQHPNRASWWAWFIHNKAMHDKTSIPTARWHVYEAIRGKNKSIPCMDQLQ